MLHGKLIEKKRFQFFREENCRSLPEFSSSAGFLPPWEAAPCPRLTFSPSLCISPCRLSPARRGNGEGARARLSPGFSLLTDFEICAFVVQTLVPHVSASISAVLAGPKLQYPKETDFEKTGLQRVYQQQQLNSTLNSAIVRAEQASWSNLCFLVDFQHTHTLSKHLLE